MTGYALPPLDLSAGALTGDEAFRRVREGLRDGLSSEDSAWRRARDKLISWAGFSNFEENEVLDSIFGDGSVNINTAPTYLALTTAAVGEADTGSTLVEANYTGYARKSVAAADMGPASGGAKSNSARIQFAAATGGTSTVIGWAQCTALTVGNVIVFGTCTSTVISSTQTPATVAIAALSVTLD